MNPDIFLFSSFFFISGIFIGSFLNVLADRLPKDENVITGRSHCDHCNHNLYTLDLVPIFSFLYLQGKCRYCGTSLSWYYPFSEILTGIAFLLIYVVFRNSSVEHIAYSLLVVSCLIVIFSADLKHGIIPDKIVFPVIAASLLFYSILFGTGVFPYVLSGLGAGLLFFALFFFTKGRGMGFGDVKLALLMGVILGFPGIVYALYIGFLTGAGVSLILILWKKKKLKSTIPFGPFLVFGTLTVFLFPSRIEQLAKMVLP